MADPKNALQYEYNAIGCNTKLDVQDAKIRTELTGCQRDTFVSFHKVFTYFADRYLQDSAKFSEF